MKTLCVACEGQGKIKLYKVMTHKNHNSYVKCVNCAGAGYVYIPELNKKAHRKD